MSKPKEEMFFMGGEVACCHDCRDEWILGSLGFYLNPLRWIWNPEPKPIPIQFLFEGEDSLGNGIYLCRKHWLNRGLGR